MQFDFDRIIQRQNTNSIKYDFARQRGMPADVLPLWVADMDFQSPPCVLEALEQKCRHGIFGYSDTDDSYGQVLQNWFHRRFGWDIAPEWIVKTPGVVTAIHIAILALTEPGDGVIIQQPVYYPFQNAVLHTKRTLVVNKLILEDGRYHIDFDDFERKIISGGVKLFILCSPHNPIGRVWTTEELERLGDICLRHGVTVISDEIHADFVYAGNRHQVFADIKSEFRDHSITCTAPSKTFNLAGLQMSNILIPDAVIRKKFVRQFRCSGLSEPGIMGIVACQAAYSHGEEWLEALKRYLTGNLDMVRLFLREHLPEIRLVEPEGTYLAWLDCRGLGLSTEALEDLIIHKAGLWLDAGTMFGQGGDGFQRVNIACPRSTLTLALQKLENAVRSL